MVYIIDTDNTAGFEAISPAKTAQTTGPDLSIQVTEDNIENSVGVPVDHISTASHDKSVAARLKDYMLGHNGKELVACILVGALFCGLGYLIEEPRERPIPVQYLESSQSYVLNLSLNKTSEGDSVPDWAVVVLAVLVGPGVQMIISYLFGDSLDIHRTLCINLLALNINNFATWALKAYAGYLRPCFYQVCEPNETFDQCTNEEDDARDSFPSGHASFAFVSMTMLYLYLERTFGVSSVEQAFVITSPIQQQSSSSSPTTQKRVVGLEYSHPPVYYRFASIVCALPLVVATFVAASRVADNRHHPVDIVCGAFVGSFLGYFFHTLWYVLNSSRWRRF